MNGAHQIEPLFSKSKRIGFGAHVVYASTAASPVSITIREFIFAQLDVRDAPLSKYVRE